MFANSVKRRMASLLNFFYLGFVCNRDNLAKYEAIAHIFILKKLIKPFLKNIKAIVSG